MLLLHVLLCRPTNHALFANISAGWDRTRLGRSPGKPGPYSGPDLELNTTTRNRSLRSDSHACFLPPSHSPSSKLRLRTSITSPALSAERMTRARWTV